MCSIFLVILLLITETFTYGATKESISSIFEGFGYSPKCIAEAFASCEKYSKFDDPVGSTDFSLSDVLSTSIRASDCQELRSKGDSTSGVRTVYPYNCCKDRNVVVYCDQTTDGGGWTVIQSRDNLTIREDFYRTWVEYSLGFGNVSGEFWLGLNNINALVSSSLMEMRADLEDYDGVKRWAKYGFFHVGDSASQYVLNVGKCTGDAGDGFTYHNGMKFSTYDRDNDKNAENESSKYRGAHWYPSGHASNFNGYQYIGNYPSYGDGIGWYHFRGHQYSLRKVSLKVRPAFRKP